MFTVAGAPAATAPVNAPVLTSAVFASPVGVQWTPAPDLLNVTQSVLRAPGPCTSPPSGGQYRMTFGDATTSSYSDPAPDGTYCYYIQAADLLTPAYSPGLTVVVDTLPPVAAVVGVVCFLGPRRIRCTPNPYTTAVTPARETAAEAPMLKRLGTAS